MTREIPKTENKTFLTFHNLQLEITEKGDRLDLTPKSHRALMRFFEFTRIADVKDATTYEKRLSERMKCHHSGTLGGYEFKHGVKWVDSLDFQAFLADYRRMWTLVSNYLNGFNTRWDLIWLSNLGETAIGKKEYTAVPKNEDFRTDGSDIYPHKDYNFIEYQTGDGSHRLWHGLDLGWLAREIYDSLRLLVLEKGFELRRCAVDDCKKLFVPQARGSEQRFCSVNCRTKAFKRKKKQRLTHSKEATL